MTRKFQRRATDNPHRATLSDMIVNALLVADLIGFVYLLSTVPL